MGKDWRDFKVENGGIAGAREVFENACETLFKKQYPKQYVSQMEVSRGDGGIDIFIGKYSKEPIIVVQCKFFLEDFGSSQKDQIKKSFNKAYNNKDYKLSKWILCIPRLFTQKDNEWWFDWIEKQDMEIKLINGNELISLMKEYNIYNQIFQMEVPLMIQELHEELIPKKKIYISSEEKLVLPPSFKAILDKSDSKFMRITSETSSKYETHLNISKLEFFPDSSDFGITHVNNLLQIQEELITEKSKKLLTAEDITTLVIATIGQDIAMHLNYEGFQLLLSSSKEWKEKWDKFFQKARKYNESKLKELFGDTEPIIYQVDSREDMSDRDYLLIGEFIRVNHSELVEYISKEGFPIPDGTFIDLSSSLIKEKKILEFSALLAKSHGMNLRDTFDKIEKIGSRGNLLAPYNIHIIYLMVIFRLADYLDIYENRNLKVMFGLKSFMSNISKFEWDKGTYVDVQKTHWDDVEAVFVGVEPQNSDFFIKLKGLFQSMQYELDLSWAVLGEVYSKDTSLKEFSIKYRRIKSTLDNEIEFREKVNYVPKKISFDSDPELLKLLIAPLYGNDPSYGVRELLQNAIDACKEYQELTNDSSYEPTVNIYLLEEDGKYSFEIVDNGLGMLEDTIVNYFLKAGASFRNSDFWTENLKDEENKTKVTRTGRFGVGLLAVFLLGNKITVKTRYYKSEDGYEFTTHLSDSQINIVKSQNLNVGTSIKIEISEEVYKKFKKKTIYTYEKVSPWHDWYKLNDVQIKFISSLKKIDREIISEELYIPIEQEEYTQIKWFFEKKSQLCIVNGFVIPNGKIKLTTNIDIARYYGNYYYGNNTNFNIPSILITDKEGKLPLNLSRNNFLNNELVFERPLIVSMIDVLFDELINYHINKTKILENLYFISPIMKEKIIFHKNGFCLLNSFTIKKNKINKIIHIDLNSKDYSSDFHEFIVSLLDKGLYIVCTHDSIKADSYGYSSSLDILSSDRIFIDKYLYLNSANIIIPKDKYKKLFTYNKTYLKMGLKDYMITSDNEYKKSKKLIPFEEESNNFVRNYYKEKRESIFDLDELDRFENIGLILEMFIDYENMQEIEDVEYYFYNLMDEYFKDKDSYWIPYS